MTTYWLSRDGGTPEGPFGESQLIGMWNAGQVTATAQVSDTEIGDWMPLTDIIDMAESDKKQERERQVNRQRALAKKERIDRAKKSPGVGVILGILIPGGGHLYAGEIWQGLVGLLLVAIMTIGTGWIGIVLWVIFVIDSAGAVNRYNKKLK